MKNVLEYKDFIGSVEVSLEDNILFGKILYINGLITYEANTVDELNKEFQAAVDDYIEFCQEQGLDAYKSFNGKFNVRISPELHKQASLLATKQNITLNAFVCKAIQNEIAATSREISVVYTYMERELIEFSEKINTRDFYVSDTKFQERPFKLHVNTSRVTGYAN
ncbi:type II toxin-antitoxin system HicB family antitoxin [Pasteurella oralis]|uniref:type II toxin-antitoxin system HicB family antitoxin n=1 Tax=Pasteurella oralis TaxID=1071947 RepID=UPI000C7A4982|nr:type II toxin-antitoxin system HicB family antitoxin [Pasteurella oralis]